MVQVSERLQKYLNVTEDAINKKMQEIVNRRSTLPMEEMFDEASLAADYIELFTKEEILACFINAASNAGYLDLKLQQLVAEGNISRDLFAKVMSDPLPSEDEIAKIYKQSDEEDDDEEEFI